MKHKKPVQVYSGDGKCPKCGGCGIVIETKLRKPTPTVLDSWINCTCPAGVAASKGTVLFGGTPDETKENSPSV